METDLIVVGGGINGVGIARDAAGRGLTVVLVEKSDLSSGTSSASSKLIHGGLRYLEQYQFRLVREALSEREILLRAAPHIVRPMRFVMPHVPGLRPRWLIRAGLFLYDHLARRDKLPPSASVKLRDGIYEGLKGQFSHGYAYSDCWVDDSRLVILNAMDAAARGATILTGTRFIQARREGARWVVVLENPDRDRFELHARALVNAAGPWIKQIVNEIVSFRGPFPVRLVRGSHIVVPRIYPGEHAFILQNNDGRVIFAYPYHGAYTLIGTTDEEHTGSPDTCFPEQKEIDYLCRAANFYFARPISPRDVVWSYAGIRALAGSGGTAPSKITRDYVLRIIGSDREAPLVSVIGGKITTYRKLAERLVDELGTWLNIRSHAWTRTAALPGGDVGGNPIRYLDELMRACPGIDREVLSSMMARHGTLARSVLGPCASTADLGQHFGHGLYAREVDYFIEQEWARCADDILWRRTKEGLYLDESQQTALDAYIRQRLAKDGVSQAP